MKTEPARLLALIDAALAATVGVLIGFEVISPVAGAAVIGVLSAWMLVAGELVRDRVTPNASIGNLRRWGP